MAKLIKIGNSRGIRIPKATIEQAQLEGKELEFKVVENGLLVQPVRKPRQGWKEQFERVLQSQKDSQLDKEWLDAPLLDEEDWEW